MPTTAKLVADLTVTLSGMRTHEGVIASHTAQAASDDVAQRLRQLAAREQVVADRLARALRGLGAPAPRRRPSWLPSPAAVAMSAAAQAQPLGEALVLEATPVRMLADRARVVREVAASLDRTAVADVASQVSDLYDEYAGWLVQTAAVLAVGEEPAPLVASASQRVAGYAKDVVGAPLRFYGKVADRAAAGVGEVTERVRGLVGLGHEKVDEAVDTVTETVTDTASTAKDTVEDALTPVQAADLAVSRYDSRSAADAAKAVRELSDLDAVSTVMAYEAQHKDRKTVLDAGDKRVAQLADASS